jgi:hypothetical protein
MQPTRNITSKIHTHQQISITIGFGSKLHFLIIITYIDVSFLISDLLYVRHLRLNDSTKLNKNHHKQTTNSPKESSSPPEMLSNLIKITLQTDKNPTIFTLVLIVGIGKACKNIYHHKLNAFDLQFNSRLKIFSFLSITQS